MASLSHTQSFAACLGATLAVDGAMWLSGRFKTIKGRWFAVHGIVNMGLVAFCVRDVVKMLQNPIVSMDPAAPYSLAPAYISASLHIYHMAMPWFKPLYFDDYLHHIAFAGILGSAQLSYRWGPGSNLFMFFVCGLPGGLDYLMLAAVKENLIDPITEKKINSDINTWVRAPGCVACAAFIYACWAAGTINPKIPGPVVLTTAALCYANGQYYGARVVASHAVHDAARKAKYQTE